MIIRKQNKIRSFILIIANQNRILSFVLIADSKTWISVIDNGYS